MQRVDSIVSPPRPPFPDAATLMEIDPFDAAQVHPTRVTQSRALSSEFCLTAKDLSRLAYEEARNPYYRNAAPMKLYTYQDVLAAAHAKHGGPGGVTEAVAKRAARGDKARATRAANQLTRRRALEAALGRVGLVIRADSSLCDAYIRHGDTKQWPLRAVVGRLAEMKWLHEHTAYRSVLSTLRRAARLEGRYWDRIETEDDAQNQILVEHGGRWPNLWPWLHPWTPEKHVHCSTQFKTCVRTVLLCALRHNLPMPAVMDIVRRAAEHLVAAPKPSAARRLVYDTSSDVDSFDEIED